MSKMNKGLLIGACALAIASTGALVGSYYKEDIKEWWNETFQKESKEEVKLLSVGDNLTSKTNIEIDMVKFAEYIEKNKTTYSQFIESLNGGSNNSSICLIENAESIYLVAYSGSIYISNNENISAGFYLRVHLDDADDKLEDLAAVGTIKINCNIFGTELSRTKITSILGLTIEDDEVKEDLGIVKIYEEVEKE